MQVTIYKLLSAKGIKVQHPVGYCGDLDYNSITPTLYLLGENNQILHSPTLLSISADGMRFRGMEQVGEGYRLQEWWVEVLDE